MRTEADKGRYDYITEYIRKHYPQAQILDLGCGEGILLEKLNTTDYLRYVGVDFSEVAITNAHKLKNSKANFIVGDAAKPPIEGTFDVIIYNETLYYLPGPKSAVRSMFAHLNPGGTFIISMVDKHGKERAGLWNKMDEILTTTDKVSIKNKQGDSWTIKTYKLPE